MHRARTGIAPPWAEAAAVTAGVRVPQSQPYIARVLTVVSHAANLPTVIHCTHGKDRTGLIVALLGLILGCSERHIVQDYVISEEELRVGRSSAQEKGEIAPHMVTDDVIASSAEVMQEVVCYLRERYGGIDGYIKAIGLSQDKVHDIRRNLLLPEVHDAMHQPQQSDAHAPI